MRRTSLLLGFAAGYTLGSRAGRERYEQIKRLASKVQESQTAQSAAGVVRQQAQEAAVTARREAWRRLTQG